MNELEITKDNFQSEVAASDKPVLVDFWADWCGPCKMMAPVISQFAEEHPEIKVCKCNVDQEIALASQFNIMSIPFIALFRNGKIENTTIGYQNIETLEEILK